eukprot:4010690-Karenia_brevis.AAC.1
MLEQDLRRFDSKQCMQKMLNHMIQKNDSGKQSAGYDALASDVNDAFESITPSIVVGEIVASEGAP